MKNKYFILLCFYFNMSLLAQEVPLILNGSQLYIQGKYQQAIELSLKELKRDSRNIDSYVVLIWSLISLKRYQEARRYIDIVYPLASSDARVVEVQGEINFYTRNYTEAEKYFYQYIRMAPQGYRVAKVYVLLTEIYYQRKQYGKALVSLSYAFQLGYFISDYRKNLLKNLKELASNS